MKNKGKILLVEDDPNLSFLIKDYLDIIGYKTTIADDGEIGLTTYETQKFDILIVDIMMPKKDGYTLVKEIRQSDENIPIIFLSAKTLKEDKIEGFKVGADDYLTKPFSTEELRYRIEAVLKRSQKQVILFDNEEKEVYEIGKITYDYTNMMLKKGDWEYHLTRKEADLLKLLCLKENQLLPREVALRTIWGDDDYFISRSMDVFITKLRKYLKKDPNVAIINIHGSGFKLVNPNTK